MSLAQLSDLHVDRADSPNVQRVRRMLATLRRVRPRPDLLLLTGDLAEHGSPAQYAILRDLLGDDWRVAMLPGNHDDAALLHATFPELTPPPGGCLRVETPELAVICVDSTVPGKSHGEIRPATLAALAAGIAAARKPVVVALHHPPVEAQVPALEGMGLRDAKAFCDRLLGLQPVVAVLAGHYHRAQFRAMGGCAIVVAPSVAPSLVPDSSAPRFRTEPAQPAGLLHEWHGGFTSLVLLAAPEAPPTDL